METGFYAPYYDDGSALGSSKNEECRIDAIAQAWSVISGAGKSEYVKQAMKSVNEQLVSEPDGIIRLLTPPFDKTNKNPGYIKGYIPGVRENGGQYTHAALWVVQAEAMLREGSKAVSLMEMLCPVNHARTFDDVQTYKVEPYSVPADIYGVSPHIGRGGWTWYTGSAGWMYRIFLESILGFTIDKGKNLVINPCISKEWNYFKIGYKPSNHDTSFDITIQNPDHVETGIQSASIDDKPAKIVQGRVKIRLKDDGEKHELLVIMGKDKMKVDSTIDIQADNKN